MENEFGFKEIYKAVLRSTYLTEINGRTVQPNEIIALFDKIQLANFQEIKQNATARGGYDNRGLVFWSETREVRLTLTQGIFSKDQLSLMTNAKLIKEEVSQIALHNREFLESDENYQFTLAHLPIDNTLFIYDKTSGARLQNFTQDGQVITLETQYQDVIVDYSYYYTNPTSTLIVGQNLTNGFLSFEGRTRVKDDITGNNKTGIIQIPKLKLMSDLVMRLGERQQPILGQIDALALPQGSRDSKEVMKITFLDEDIDSDI